MRQIKLHFYHNIKNFSKITGVEFFPPDFREQDIFHNKKFIKAMEKKRKEFIRGRILDDFTIVKVVSDINLRSFLRDISFYKQIHRFMLSENKRISELPLIDGETTSETSNFIILQVMKIIFSQLRAMVRLNR